MNVQFYKCVFRKRVIPNIPIRCFIFTFCAFCLTLRFSCWVYNASTSMSNYELEACHKYKIQKFLLLDIGRVYDKNWKLKYKTKKHIIISKNLFSKLLYSSRCLFMPSPTWRLLPNILKYIYFRRSDIKNHLKKMLIIYFKINR